MLLVKILFLIPIDETAATDFTEMNEKVEISIPTEYTGPTNITQAFEKMRRLLSNAAADTFEEGEGTEVIKNGTINLESPEGDELNKEVDVSETIEVPEPPKISHAFEKIRRLLSNASNEDYYTGEKTKSVEISTVTEITNVAQKTEEHIVNLVLLLA